jgi:hypothetical protein
MSQTVLPGVLLLALDAPLAPQRPLVPEEKYVAACTRSLERHCMGYHGICPPDSRRFPEKAVVHLLKIKDTRRTRCRWVSLDGRF